MALLDEQLVDEWLNRNGFFTMRGIKCGIDEIDLLAVKHCNIDPQYWHVEVQISYRPIGYIGGDTNARKRSDEEIKGGVEQWVLKKFKSEKKVEKRNSILPNVNWRFILVHAVLRDENELKYMKGMGVELIPYKQILTELRSSKSQSSSSVASNIVEILQYIEKD